MIRKNKNNIQHDENPLSEIFNINDIELERISKGVKIENIYNLFDKCFSFLLKTTIFLLKVSGVYLLWICLHYFASHLYIKFCVPSTPMGFLMSPFLISTPHCQGLRWIVYNAANVINNMWILIGAWLYSVLWVFNKDNIASVNS